MAEATLTPQQAAQALTEIEGYEETLTARVGSMTGMVWGIVSPAIFVTYGFADKLPMALMPFLWLPWTLAGVALTSALWKMHAITLRGPGAKSGSWKWSLGFAAFFAGALLGLHYWPGHNGAFPYMVVVNGAVPLFLFVRISVARGRLVAWPLLVAGVLIVAGAFVLASLDLDMTAMTFAAAGLVGVGFLGSGIVGFVRG